MTYYRRPRRDNFGTQVAVNTIAAIVVVTLLAVVLVWFDGCAKRAERAREHLREAQQHMDEYDANRRRQNTD
jgi:hypothetical protein